MIGNDGKTERSDKFALVKCLGFPPRRQVAFRRTAMRVFLTGNADKPEVIPIFDSLSRELPTVCDVIGASLGWDYSGMRDAKPDLAVVVGGDGTLIGAAREVAGSGIALAGVNAGKLGFLADFCKDELLVALKEASDIGDIVSERMMLSIRIVRAGSRVLSKFVAVNDCVVRDPYRMLRMSIELDDQHLTDMASDGVIICTPTGSTAYNLAAYGPLLQPAIPAMVLTPICPHGLTFRPLVVEANKTVTIRSETGSGVIIDGQKPVGFSSGDSIEVSRHPSPFMLVRNPAHPPWHAMRLKLNWGQ